MTEFCWRSSIFSWLTPYFFYLQSLHRKIWDLVSWNEYCFRRKKEKTTLYFSQVTIKMANIMMQLRKCCNHPYLLEYPLDEQGEFKVDQQVIKASGKMLLLDRMLTELKRQGHKVCYWNSAFCGHNVLINPEVVMLSLVCVTVFGVGKW